MSEYRDNLKVALAALEHCLRISRGGRRRNVVARLAEEAEAEIAADAALTDVDDHPALVSPKAAAEKLGLTEDAVRAHVRRKSCAGTIVERNGRREVFAYACWVADELSRRGGKATEQLSRGVASNPFHRG